MKDEAYTTSIEPDWDEVERLRSFVAAWIFALRRDTALRDAVSLITSELIANAVRHGAKTRQKIDYELRVEGGRITLRVTNVPAAPGRPATLFERIHWLASQPNGAAAYGEQLKRIAAGQAEGLGLVRLCFEADCSLGARLLGDGRVQVESVLRSFAGTAAR